MQTANKVSAKFLKKFLQSVLTKRNRFDKINKSNSYPRKIYDKFYAVFFVLRSFQVAFSPKKTPQISGGFLWKKIKIQII